MFKNKTIPEFIQTYLNSINVKMDVLLDVLDTFVLDRAYAVVLPVHDNAIKPSVLYNENVGRYLELVPSQWAYLSRLPREHILRQFLSFFLITW